MSRVLYKVPVTITGEGSLLEQGERLCLGKRALIVTGPRVARQACTRALLSLLQKKGVEYRVFSDIAGEPDDTMIAAGAQKFCDEKCDFMIAVGGGSPMDTMKAIAVAVKYPGEKLRTFMGKEIPGPFVPMAAVPTTAGTGSEVTMFTVITDTQTQVKMLLKGPDLIPDVAVVDPSFSLSAPQGVTAHTGLDALTHAIEAYTSRRAQPLTDVLAVDAVRKIMDNLPKAYDDGSNLAAREQMALAAYEAGICITSSSVTIVHGMSRPIGALFHVPHGLSNAMLLPACLSFALDGAYERFGALGRAIGAASVADTDKEASRALVRRVKDLCDYCHVPTPEQYGIGREAFFENIDKMAEDAIASGSPGNTQKKVTKEDCITIYKELWE